MLFFGAVILWVRIRWKRNLMQTYQDSKDRCSGGSDHCVLHGTAVPGHVADLYDRLRLESSLRHRPRGNLGYGILDTVSLDALFPSLVLYAQDSALRASTYRGH